MEWMNRWWWWWLAFRTLRLWPKTSLIWKCLCSCNLFWGNKCFVKISFFLLCQTFFSYKPSISFCLDQTVIKRGVNVIIKFQSQCDQTLTYKVDQHFPKVAQKVTTVTIRENWCFQNTFGLLVKDNLSPRTFKNCPIWSHFKQSMLGISLVDRDEQPYLHRW